RALLCISRSPSRISARAPTRMRTTLAVPRGLTGRLDPLADMIGEVAVDEVVAELAARVVVAQKRPEVGPALIQPGEGRGGRAEHLPPVWPGVQRREPLLDRGDHGRHRAGVL